MREDCLRYAGICVELTRKCNMSCPHCMRGEAQNKTITKEIIDRLCNELTMVGSFRITGGEPFLELDMLHYLINKVRLIPNVYFLNITTNGTVLTPSIIEDMEEFCITSDAFSQKRKCMLAISKDPYHKAVYDTAMTYYTELADKANERIRIARSEQDDASPAITISANDNAANLIQYSGRAVDMVNNDRTQYRLDKNLKTRSCTPHRIKVKDSVVKCTIGVTVNGNVTLYDEGSWDEADGSSIGNIKKHSLRYLIEQHNHNCLLTCLESISLDRAERLKIATDEEIPYDERLTQTLMLVLIQTILKLREELRREYKFVPTYEIIDEINSPSQIEMFAYVAVLAKLNGNKTLEDLQETLSGKLSATPEQFKGVEAIANALDYLRHHGNEYVRHRFENHINSLKIKNKMYRWAIIAGEMPVDDKCYSCLEEGDTIYQN